MRRSTLALTIAIVFTGAARTATTGPEERLTVVLFVVNEAGIPADVIKRAQRQATRVYESVAVRIAWTDDPSIHRHFTVKIALQPIAGADVSPHSMGAVPGARKPVLAYAFYGPIEALAGQLGSSRANRPRDIETILGHVMAHEIGHLLLPMFPHSASGVMRASWDYAQLEMATKGWLTFTKDQVKALHQRLDP